MIKLMICALLLTLAVGCGNEAEAMPEYRPGHMSESTSEHVSEHTRITPQRAQEMMEQYDVLILDVRTSGEFETGHIPGAVLLPVDRISAEAEYLIPDWDQIILVYCRSGNRSNTAAMALVELGYRAVYDFGGIADWSGPVVR